MVISKCLDDHVNIFQPPSQYSQIATLGQSIRSQVPGQSWATDIKRLSPLFIKNVKILDKIKSKNKTLYTFLLNKWYFDEIYEFIFTKPIKAIGLFFWRSGDIKTIDRFGPDGISKLVKIISNKATKLQSGYIFDYAFVMLLGFSLLLTFFIIYK